jgi:hypothetical protein
MKDLYRLQRVSKGFQNYILSSLRLRRVMFLAAPSIGTVVPVRVPDRPLRGILPRTKIIWAKKPRLSPKLIEQHLVHQSPTEVLPSFVLTELCVNNEVLRPDINPALNHWKINRKCDSILLRSSPVSHVERGLRLVPDTVNDSFGCDSRRDMFISQPPVVDVVIGRSDTMWGMFEVHKESGVTIADVLRAQQAHNQSRKIAGWGRAELWSS